MLNQDSKTESTSPSILDQEDLVRRLDQFDKDIKENSKKFDSIQMSLDLIYQDRDLLTDTMEGLNKIRELLMAVDKKNETLSKSISYDVWKKSEQVRAEIHETTDKAKDTIIQKVVDRIIKLPAKENVHFANRFWYRKLFFWKYFARLSF